MDVVQRVRAGLGDFLLFGITPPKASTPVDRLERITQTTLGRLHDVEPDAVVLYDIAEEQDRNPETRPFPFLATLDPSPYLAEYLAPWTRPAVVYRAVGKYTEEELTAWLRAQDTDRVMTVLVGASSRQNVGATSLGRAYELRREVSPDLLVGGVVIPERHTLNGDEHHRMIAKQASGVSFFISQILYDANATKNLLAAYVDECEAQAVDPKPVVFTHSVCGSVRTLDFLEWLGVTVPWWMQRELRRAENTLDASLEQATVIAADVMQYARRIGVPAGINVESVSTRRVENDAAARLASELKADLALGSQPIHAAPQPVP
ncbi:MAG: 5,10-methylenetetrahydrofolate reductase [Arachnia sp.]